jgi:hypothetical protein
MPPTTTIRTMNSPTTRPSSFPSVWTRTLVIGLDVVGVGDGLADVLAADGAAAGWWW